ncbi:hypothetical protein [Streptomyces anulatus]|uniref:hypothetical protein n=1 Tax=Streptomyces anulatus TaxID=1892 RepID=UPI00344AC6FF
MNAPRQLPDDCRCPAVRHNDGSPLIPIPNPACRHHGRIFCPPPPATVTPIRRPTPPLVPLIAAVCEQDRGENPFGWSDPTPDDMPATCPAP